AAAVLALAARRRWLPAIGLGWWLGAIAPTATIAALDYPWPGLARWLYVGLPGLLLVAYSATRRLPTRARQVAFTAPAAAEACRKRLTEKTRRVKSAHANGEIGAGASTKR